MCSAKAQDLTSKSTNVESDSSALPSVIVTGRHYDNSVGSSDAASQGTIRSDLMVNRPSLRPGEILEYVPGLIVTQHSGDGKANQYFLRGFNLDHGTDFATTLNGMPVNMPTHGHGQGYSDLNFLIPELVDTIEYRKGPYFATHGDFSAAGAADILYKTKLSEPFAQLTVGQNGYVRAVGANSIRLSNDADLINAVELMTNDGPWSLAENLLRKSVVLQLTQGSRDRGSTFSIMGYDAKWNSTDQIPQRLIEAGSFNNEPFGRFDAIDNTDGGNTSRFSLSMNWNDKNADDETKVTAYAMRYSLKLFSNFTYAMDRVETGDQFSQQDDRNIFGAKFSKSWDYSIGNKDIKSEIGLQVRNDRIRVGLYETQARQLLNTIRLDEVNETILGIYGQSSIALAPMLRTIVGLRNDVVNFDVNSISNLANSGVTKANLLSPKFTLVAGPWSRTEFFFNWGKGFHSNDARGTTTKVDPKTGDTLEPVPGLVASRGWELGVRSEFFPQLQSSFAFWNLNADSELVYVGDSGTTEASNASTRYGIEFNNRWTPNKHFLFDADLALTHARFTNGDRIPNAVDSVASIAATIKDVGPWSGSLQWRYLGTGALIEDNSIRSDPASTFNLRLTRNMRDLTGRSSSLTVDVFNLFDTKVNDIQYYYTSQLPSESEPVDDKIVHPAEPRSVRVTFRTSF